MIKGAVDDEDETVVERYDYLDEFCKVAVRYYWQDVLLFRYYRRGA